MVNDLQFTDGIYGSQVANDNANRDKGPGLPGMEHLGEDAIMSEGIEMHEDIPEGMEFIPGSVVDGHIEFYTGMFYIVARAMLSLIYWSLFSMYHSYIMLLFLNVLFVTLIYIHRSTIRSRNQTILHGIRRLLRRLHIQF